MGKELKTIGFALAVCLICSLLLSVVYSGLKDEQERNKKNELKTKVLMAFGVKVTNDKGKPTMTPAEIDEFFVSSVQGKVLDRSGKLVQIKFEDLSSEQINNRSREDGLKEYYPFFIYDDKEKGVERYAIHVSGMGLWSVVKGYLALEDDLSTMSGIAFYDHGETPGLGGEIEKDYFRAGFSGKSLAKGGEVANFRIIKPGAPGGEHCVDGISGATMTCNGVMEFINSDFAVYNKFFNTIRKQK